MIITSLRLISQQTQPHFSGMWTFSLVLSFSCFFFSSQYPTPQTPHSLRPPPPKTPLIHIPTNTHLRLISSHTHTTLPPTHPTQHLWLITSKEDTISLKRLQLLQSDKPGRPNKPPHSACRNILHFKKWTPASNIWSTVDRDLET